MTSSSRILIFILIAFTWSWAWWLWGLHLLDGKGQPADARMEQLVLFFFLGVYGPALSAMVTSIYFPGLNAHVKEIYYWSSPFYAAVALYLVLRTSLKTTGKL
jgi:hypothetical protein